jgi:hypothetical protein
MSITVGVEGNMPYTHISGPETIILPLPDDVSTSIAMQYDQAEMNAFKAYADGAKVSDMSSLKDTAKHALHNTKFIVKQTAWLIPTMGSGVGRKRAGGILNANKEMLFNGTDFRRFSFTWTVMPTNKRDAKNVKDALTAFQKYSVGSLSNAGRIIKYPESWKIRFSEAILVDNIKDCFVTGVSANFSTGGGVRVHEDGYPVTTTININFVEVTIRTSEDF